MEVFLIHLHWKNGYYKDVNSPGPVCRFNTVSSKFPNVHGIARKIIMKKSCIYVLALPDFKIGFKVVVIKA